MGGGGCTGWGCTEASEASETRKETEGVGGAEGGQSGEDSAAGTRQSVSMHEASSHLISSDSNSAVRLSEKLERRLAKAAERRRKAAAKAGAAGTSSEEFALVLADLKDQADRAEASLREAQRSEAEAHETARKSRARLDKAYSSLITLRRLSEQLSTRHSESREAQLHGNEEEAAQCDQLVTEMRQRADAVSASLERAGREKAVQVERRAELKARVAELLDEADAKRAVSEANASAERVRCGILQREAAIAQATVDKAIQLLDTPRAQLQERDAEVKASLETAAERLEELQKHLGATSTDLTTLKEEVSVSSRRLESARLAKEDAIIEARNARLQIRAAKAARQSAREASQLAMSQRDKMRAVHAALRKSMGVSDSEEEENNEANTDEMLGGKHGIGDEHADEVDGRDAEALQTKA